MSVVPHALPPRAPFGAPPPPAPEPPVRHLYAVADVPLDFDDVVRALTPRLRRYATRRLGDRHEAEELVQEALLRAYQHRGELRTEDDVAAWTTCVTGRLVVDRLRVRGRSLPFADVPEGRPERDTADVVVARDQARTALDALDAMPPRQAAVLWAREVEGLGYEEIGRRYVMTEPAVRSLLTRARKALRREYAVRGGTLPAAGLAVLAPWAAGTGWLGRLRAGLLKAAPAAFSVAAAGLVSGAFVTLVPGPAEPAAAPASVRQTALPVAAVAPLPAPSPASLPAAVPAAPAPASFSVPAQPAPAAPRSAAGAALSATGLDDTCLDGGSAGAGGTSCSPEAGLVTLSPDVAGLPLPDAVEAQVPDLQTNYVRCEALPDTPLTSCTPPREDS